LTSLLQLEPREIEDGLRSGKIIVSVVGLGHIGLPLAVVLANSGAHVIGVDVDRTKIDALRAGVPTMYEPGLEQAFKSIIGTRLEVSGDLARAVSHASVIVICVGTPADRTGKPSLTQVKESCGIIADNLQEGTVVIVRSTVPPGTTGTLVRRILEERTRMKMGVDFGLLYCPERLAGARAMTEIISVPHIVAGFDEKSVSAGRAIFHFVGGETVIPESVEVAEMAKLFDNVYRHVNIALANELGLICEAFGVDMLQVLKACNTGPRTRIMLPGAAIGGSCLTKDPRALTRLAKERGVTLKLIPAGTTVDRHILDHAVGLVLSAYKQLGRRVAGSRIAVFGLAYKGDTDDLRATAARPIVNMLRKRKASVHAYDPYVQPQDVAKTFGELRVMRDPIEAARDADCILVMANHSTLKSISLQELAQVARMPAAFVDAVQAFEPGEVLSVGFVYRGVGRVMTRPKTTT